MDEVFEGFQRVLRIRKRLAKRQLVSIEREEVSETGNSKLGEESELLAKMIQVRFFKQNKILI